jgi:hypothetical protein
MPHVSDANNTPLTTNNSPLTHDFNATLMPTLPSLPPIDEDAPIAADAPSNLGHRDILDHLNPEEAASYKEDLAKAMYFAKPFKYMKRGVRATKDLFLLNIRPLNPTFHQISI